MEIKAHFHREYVDEIINILIKKEIFLHLKILWNSSVSSITDKLLQKQIVRYTPSKQHRKKCKDDLCDINARLEFIDHKGRVTNSKTFEKEEHRKKCQDHRTVTNFRQKKCTVL